MRSLMPMTSFMRCSTVMTVRSWLRRRIRSIIWRASSGLMPAVGSSRRSSRGSQASATAISSARWSPCARLPDGSCRRCPSPTSASSPSALSVSSESRAARRPDVEAGAHRLRGDAHVLEHAELRKEVGDLEGLGDAAMGETVLRQAGDLLAPKDDLALARREGAGQHVEEGALAGPVRPDDRGEPVGEEVDADVLQGGEAAELLGDALGAKDRGHGRSQCSSDPQMPRGKNRMSSTNSVPTMICQCVVTTPITSCKQEEEEGAEKRAEEGAHAAEQRHHEHVGGVEVVQRLDRHDGEVDRVERAGQSREQAGQDEDKPAHARHVVAAGARPPLVLAQRLDDGAERRVEDAREQRQRAGHEQQDDVVFGGRVEQVDAQPEEVDGRHVDAAQAVLAAGQGHPLEDDVVDDLRQGERHHREVDAARARGEPADHRCRKAGDDDAERQSREPGHAELDDRHAAAIGAEPEQGRVPEGEHAGIAVDEVEAHGEQPEDEDVHGERLVRREPREHRQEQDRHEHAMARDPVDQAPARLRRLGIVGEGVGRHRL